MTDKVILPTELVNKILSYLGRQPYIEVADMITETHNSVKPYEEPAQEDESENEESPFRS